MLYLLPQPKKIVERDEFIKFNSIKPDASAGLDERVIKALGKIPTDREGIEVRFDVKEGNEESYVINISEDLISIKADGVNGAFYAAQTLRQIFEYDKIPCCIIEDKPDFKERGVQLDVSRGKVPTLETLKKFVDKLAYLKVNSLQIYIEHSFEFEEYNESLERTGYITAEEMKELDRYCIENFIELVPCLNTFGHLYELLQSEKYKHLSAIENYEPSVFLFEERAWHHTIDPLNPESIELINGMVDKFCENFTSDKFNICGDETYDLKNGRHKDKDTGKLYIDFMLKVIDNLRKKGKKVMMYGDILTNHPEQIHKLPDDVTIVNWYYFPNPEREIVSRFADLGRKQILTTGTWSWHAFCEILTKSVENIEEMTKLGMEFGVEGMLTTIWGDLGNIAPLELSDFSMSFGVAKSWNSDITIDELPKGTDKFIYRAEGMSQYLKELSELHKKIGWYNFTHIYSNKYHEGELPLGQLPTKEDVLEKQKAAEDFRERLSKEKYENEHKKEMLIQAEGIQLVAELTALHTRIEVERRVDANEWLKKFREAWLSKNKESELKEVEKIFITMDKGC